MSRTTAVRLFILMAVMAATFGVALALSASPVEADSPVNVYFRVEGPANQSTYPADGEYRTIYAGYVAVPVDVNITAISGITYYLYINSSSDRYMAKRISDGQEWDRGAGNSSIGATSVLASMNKASEQGGFNYTASDSFFPGMGFLVNSVDGHAGGGAVGWNYRVWNASDACSPSMGCDSFLLDYSTMPLDLPHRQVLWYWGGPSSTYPLKVTVNKSNVTIGERFMATVDYYYTIGANSFGDWQPLNESNVSICGQTFVTDTNGHVNISLNGTGTFAINASKGKDANGWYIPSDSLTQVTVNSPPTPTPTPTPTTTPTATSTSILTATPTTTATPAASSTPTASPTPTPTSTYSYPFNTNDSEVADALNYLRGVQLPNGSIGSFAESAWAAMAIAAAGEDPNDWNGGNATLVDYLKNNPGMIAGELNLGTAYARMVLAAVASCDDPSDFGGTDYLSQLKSLHDGDQFTNGFGANDTLNDDIWGLMALIAAGVSADSAMANSTINFILANQGGDGGWSWATPGNPWYWGSDVDDTAAAIMSLVSAGVDPGSPAITSALAYINSTQQGNGGFPYDAFSSPSLASTAWSIDAIMAAWQNPVGANWTKAGNNSVDFLLTFREPAGSYFDPGAWSPARERNTADAIVALLGKMYPVIPDCPPIPQYFGDANMDGRTTILDLGKTRAITLGSQDCVPGADANADGHITILDLAKIRAIILGNQVAQQMTEAIYSYSTGAGSDKWAKHKAMPAVPPALNQTFTADAGWGELNLSQYAEIAAGDGDVSTLAGSTANYTALQCRLTVSEGANSGNITSIGMTFNGTSEVDGDPLQLWVWNFNSSQWRQVDSAISLGNTSNQAYTRWTAWGKVFDDYIDVSNQIYILYSHNTSGHHLNVDYVDLRVVSH